MDKVDYDAHQHKVYVDGRRMEPAGLRAWMDAFARHLPKTRPLTWLDAGSGTGRISPALADAFGGPVHGVEPSDGMRGRALAHSAHPRVTYVAGSAESLPLPDASVDAAVLFFVWHHVSDRPKAVRELLRVVKPGGLLFVNANLADAMPDIWWFRVVPEWDSTHVAQFRTGEQVRSDFTGAGWDLVSQEEVTWMRSASLAEDHRKLTMRGMSTFDLLSPELVEEGFARIAKALPTMDQGPQFETNALFAFRRP